MGDWGVSDLRCPHMFSQTLLLQYKAHTHLIIKRFYFSKKEEFFNPHLYTCAYWRPMAWPYIDYLSSVYWWNQLIPQQKLFDRWKEFGCEGCGKVFLSDFITYRVWESALKRNPCKGSEIDIFQHRNQCVGHQIIVWKVLVTWLIV